MNKMDVSYVTFQPCSPDTQGAPLPQEGFDLVVDEELEIGRNPFF